MTNEEVDDVVKRLADYITNREAVDIITVFGAITFELARQVKNFSLEKLKPIS